ncbi:SDR family NAD(P)-dependent oxidoreductase [Compostimonas suwonensis]|uniref:Short subunit dehydrogenase n=1 Tax=Compostimonas suwonensis TaxID=1048394 RepID=A0A2M9C4G0_9MICO|nr:SDR family oxidoreductase [Compostimonas suwonensis]PJJ65420.1 short subunit dehydrogenase [Compostimonas suwonensis]
MSDGGTAGDGIAGSGAAGGGAGDGGETGVAGRTVLIAGATSEAGRQVAAALREGGAIVIAVGSNAERLEVLEARVPGIRVEQCDLTDAAAVAALAGRVHATGPVDGLVHLVGGWRGGAGITAQSDEDWAFLERSLTSLRLTSRAFYDDLATSPAGRIAMVSSTSVDRPRAGSASYTAVKAASEAWMRAIADGFARDDAHAASVIFAVTSLSGLEPLLAEHVIALWSRPAVNGSRTVIDAG